MSDAPWARIDYDDEERVLDTRSLADLVRAATH